MKILLAHNHYQQPGGEDVVFFQEGALLRQHGHDVIEFTEDNRRINEMNQLSVAADAIWSRASNRRLGQLLQEVKPDVAHFHNTLHLISPSAYYACQEAGVPVVQTLHNYRLHCPAATFLRDNRVCELCLGNVPWPAIKYACYRDSRPQTAVVAIMLTLHRWLKTWQDKVDAYIVLTDFAKRKFSEGGLPTEKLLVKPNFIDPDPGTVNNRGDFSLFIGRLSPEKGVRPLLKAWQSLRDIPLKIAGDGPLIQEMRTLVAENGLDNVEVLGRVARDDVLALMKSARLLVFPSIWYEGFPMILTEAFACGVPVITSKMGSMSEIVDDRRTGLHFKSGSAEDLAAKVEWAWSHPEEMALMGREARLEYERKYTAEKNYKLLMEIYQEVAVKAGY